MRRNSRTMAKIVALLALILLLILAGFIWFDYLGVLDAKRAISPLYRLFGRSVPEGVVSTADPDLDADRYAKRLEALGERAEELDKKDAELQEKEKDHERVSQELDERLRALEDKEKSYNLLVAETNERRGNVRKIAEYVSGMPPESAVKILLKTDDQDVIEVFRMVDAAARQRGVNSLVPYCLSLMPPDRAAEIQRKMANKPADFP